MFLSVQTREKVQERIFVENHTKNSSSFLTWLKRAIIERRDGEQNQENISKIINSLALDGLEPEIHLNPKNDDIDEWFTGSPEWIRMS